MNSSCLEVFPLSVKRDDVERFAMAQQARILNLLLLQPFEAALLLQPLEAACSFAPMEFLYNF